jgi:phosphotransferase system  glucose/maltose/N-acetylglucosamine-specific IIC component
MKAYRQYFLRSLVIVNIIYILLTWVIMRRRDIILPFLRLELGAIIISLIIGLAYTIYKSEKGKPIINVIISYLLVLPSLLVFRSNFGQILFRSAAFIYIIFVIVGIIYTIAIYVASKKYQHEVNDLNALLKNKDQEEEKTPEL